MDLLQRNISKRKDKLKMRAEVALNEIFKGRPPSSDALAENFEREVVKLKLKVCRTVGWAISCRPSAGLETHGDPWRGVADCQSRPDA